MEEPENPRYKACFKLFLNHNGKNLSLIEREMRALGYTDFNRRILYGRREDGKHKPGWIEKYGWKKFLNALTGGNTTVRECVQHYAEASSSYPPVAFPAWLKQVSPELTWDWTYQKYIYEHLQRITNGENKRLMIFLPPRHGKSELVTVRYAGWRLWNDPKMRIIVGSYNQRLADRFSRSIRKLLSEEEDKLTAAQSVPPAVAGGLMPAPERSLPARSDASAHSNAHPQPPATAGGTDRTAARTARMFPRSRTINTTSQWETAVGGGVKAVGAGAGVTGFGAQLVIIDDPVKSRAQAESETYREKIWDWYRIDIYTRLEPNGSIILIQTRWHEDDLAGRLLREMHEGGDQWEVIDLPALSEPRAVATGLPGNSADPLGRPIGTALCPERFDETALDEIRRQLGGYAFSALYQQRPTPAEGGIFKRAWFTKFVYKAPDGLKWKRGYDLAVSTKTSACYTSSFRVAFDDAGNMYIADGFRRRIEFPDQRRFIVSCLLSEKDTEHGIEKALHGEAIIQEMRRDPAVRGTVLRGVTVTTDKLTRALKWAPLAEEGKVVLVRGPWNQAFLDEICSFPGGQFDDQVDAVSLAVAMFEDRGKKFYSF